MNSLSNALRSYLTEKITSGIRSGGIAEYRALFQGPPIDDLRNLMISLGPDPKISIKIDGTIDPISVRVILIDQPNGVSGHQFVASDWSDAVTLRDKGRMVVFAAHDDVPNESFLGASTQVGQGLIQSNRIEIDGFISDNPLVGFLVGCALCHMHKDEYDIAFQWVTTVLRAIANSGLGGHQEVHRQQWRVIKRLIEREVPISSLVSLAGALGLPKPDSNLSEDYSKCGVDTLELLAVHLEDLGMGQGFDVLAKDAPEFLDSLGALRQHFLNQGVDAQAFRACPVATFVPGIDNSTGIEPSWWTELNNTTLNNLLGDNANTELDKITISVDNSLHATGGPFFVVRDSVRFAIAWPAGTPRSSGLLTWKIGKTPYEKEIDSEATIVECDAPPEHDRPIQFTFSFPGVTSKPIKIVSLQSYIPGVVVVSSSGFKAKPFKIERGNIVRMECSVSTSGTQTFSLLSYPGRFALCDNPTRSNSDEEGNGGISIRDATDGRIRLEIDVLPASMGTTVVSFAAAIQGEEVKRFKIEINAKEDRLHPCPDRYMAYVEQARSGGGAPEVDVSSSWIREYTVRLLNAPSSDSYWPVIVGPGYREKPFPQSWSYPVVLSSKGISCNVLPDQPAPAPGFLLELRDKVLNRIRAALSDQECQYIEELRINEVFAADGAIEELAEYLDVYSAYVNSGNPLATWFDSIAVFEEGDGTATLSPQPVAVLLSPLHPIRLAWQFIAQRSMIEIIEKNRKCHTAGSLPYDCMPDAMLIDCSNPAGDSDRIPFVAVSSNSPYWQVLWSGFDRAGLSGTKRSSSNALTQIFGREFGISVCGLNQGLTEGQVQRALDDAVSVLPAVSTLRVELHAVHAGAQVVEQGVFSWARRHLGSADPWHPVAHRHVEVTDLRPETHPDAASLAEVTRDTSHSLMWRKVRNASAVLGHNHLGIVSHVGAANPSLTTGNSRSSVGPGCLIRARVREVRPSSINGSHVILESRISCQSPISLGDRVERSLNALVYIFENRLASVQSEKPLTQLAFSPNTAELEASVNRSSFTAIASSETDPSSFVLDGRTYLWDYDLPDPQAGGTHASGYYLVASREKSQATRVASDCVLKLAHESGFRDTESIGTRIPDLLHEVSLRGVPTLKSIHRGGTSASGALATLAVLRLLQPNFQEDGIGLECLFPVRDGTRLRLAIPVDPFEDQIAIVRKEYDLKDSRRPDLILASIDLSQDDSCVMTLTAVEVKYRTGSISQSEIEDAYRQLDAMANLLCRIADDISGDNADATKLTEISAMEILISWIDFAFRTYSRASTKHLSRSEWARAHQQTLSALCHRRARIQILKEGRLFVIHNCISRPLDKLNTGSYRRLDISLQDCLRLLVGDRNEVSRDARKTLSPWGIDGENFKGVITISPSDNKDASQSLSIVDANRSEQEVPNGNHGSTERRDALPSSDTINQISPMEVNATVVSPPNIEGGIKFPVGNTVGELRSESIDFWPSNCALNHLNIGIVGDMGTGKTQLTKYLIGKLSSDCAGNRGVGVKFLIFDYKLDYSKPDFVDRVGAKVWGPEALPLNVLAPPPGQPISKRLAVERASFLFDTLSRVRSGLGVKQRQRLKDAVRSAFDLNGSSGQAPTISNVLSEYQRLIGHEEVDSVSSLLSDLVDFGIFTEDPSRVRPFAEFMQGIIVIRLADLKTQDHLKTIVVTFLLSMFYEHMLTIEKRPFIGHNPQLRFVDTMILIDEADNIMKGNFAILQQVLTQGREFGVGVLLASQYLGHYKKEEYNYAEPLLTWFVHKVPQVSMSDLRNVGFQNIGPEILTDIQKMQNLHCVVKTLGCEEGRKIRTIPFFKWATESSADQSKRREP